MKFELSSTYNRVKASYGKLAKAVHPHVTLPPLRITFEVTYRCNLSCPFCFQEVARLESPEFKKNSELTMEEILDVVDTVPRQTLITFNGGEVFVRKDFPDLLRAVTERGRRFNIVTNGTMLNEERNQLLVDDTNALSIGVSIDGIGETHDHIRQRKGAYDITVKGLRELAEYRNERSKRFPVIDLKTVITNENMLQLADIYRLARDIGTDYVTYSCLRNSELLFALPCRGSMDDDAFEEYPPPFTEPFDLDVLEAQLTEIFELAKEGGPALRFYPDYEEIPGILRYYSNQGTLEDYYDCRAPWTNIRVAPNGDIYPCLAYKMGNIRDESLRSVWKSDNMNRFRAELEKKLMPACLGCCFLKAKPDLKFDAAAVAASQTELLSIGAPESVGTPPTDHSPTAVDK